MDLRESRQKLSEMIFDALVTGEKRARTEFENESLYAVTLYSASGFYGLGVAVNTKEGLSRVERMASGRSDDLLEKLKDYPDLLAKVATMSVPEPEVWACEWETVYPDLPPDEAEILVDELYDYFYEDGWELESISNWFLDAVLSGIQAFSQQRQTKDDLLLGLQFSDPSDNEIDMMQHVSQTANSPTWHAKIETACEIAKQSE